MAPLLPRLDSGSWPDTSELGLGSRRAAGSSRDGSQVDVAEKVSEPLERPRDRGGEEEA